MNAGSLASDSLWVAHARHASLLFAHGPLPSTQIFERYAFVASGAPHVDRRCPGNAALVLPCRDALYRAMGFEVGDTVTAWTLGASDADLKAVGAA